VNSLREKLYLKEFIKFGYFWNMGEYFRMKNKFIPQKVQQTVLKKEKISRPTQKGLQTAYKISQILDKLWIKKTKEFKKSLHYKRKQISQRANILYAH
jgi:hypothetical protein